MARQEAWHVSVIRGGDHAIGAGFEQCPVRAADQRRSVPALTAPRRRRRTHDGAARCRARCRWSRVRHSGQRTPRVAQRALPRAQRAAVLPRHSIPPASAFVSSCLRNSLPPPRVLDTRRGGWYSRGVDDQESTPVASTRAKWSKRSLKPAGRPG